MTNSNYERSRAFGPFDDRQILPFDVWCWLNNLSQRTGRRILASGNGPRITQLSAHRIGIAYADNRAWQESRTRGGLQKKSRAEATAGSLAEEAALDA
jgi:hypothetical protein